MSDAAKKIIVIGIILLVLTIFAWHSISMFSLSTQRGQAPLLPPAIPDPSASIPIAETPFPARGNAPVISIPTDEEIRQSIEDQNQKQETMKKLIAARNEKAEKVMASAAAALASPDAQETVSENTPPPLSPEARAERNKELRNGIYAHRYFPR